MTARDYYGPQELMAGVSIPATEHSTVTTWGRDREEEAMRHFMEKIPRGPLSLVSDSYDIFRLLDEVIGGSLRGLVEGREGGSVVVRPDSGDPPTMVVRVLNILGDKFGTSTNKRGYKVLPDCVRVIQ